MSLNRSNEIITKNETLDELNFKIHKLMSGFVRDKLKKCGFKKYSLDVDKCGSFLIFSKQRHIKTKEERKRLFETNFCKFRFCPTCSWRRAKNLGGELLQVLEFYREKMDIDFLFLTLTIKNPDINDLKSSVSHINKSFQRMAQTKRYRSAILGHLKALEILGSHTSFGEVHPHLHVLLIVRKSYFKKEDYIKHSEWVEMWQKALRVDYAPSVKIEKIRPKKNSNLTDLQSAVKETVKYVLKYTDLIKRPDEDFIEIVNQTYKMRFISTAGILKKINLKKIENDLINFSKEVEEQWEHIEFELYDWSADKEDYIKAKDFNQDKYIEYLQNVLKRRKKGVEFIEKILKNK